MARWRVVLGLTLQVCVVSACGGSASKGGGGSETGFLACSDDTQCPAGKACLANQCVFPDLRNTPQSSLTACANAVELPSQDEVWWESEWSLALPTAVRNTCEFQPHSSMPIDGGADVPTVIARWVAPHDGTYYLQGWSRDLPVLMAHSFQCGVLGGVPTGCAALWPDASLPAIPFDSSVGGAGGSIGGKAGDVTYITFQHNDSEPPPPDHGSVILNITRRPF